jgi:hypothetical protein
MLRPWCSVMDIAVRRMPASPFRRVEPDMVGEELDADTFLQYIHEFSKGKTLGPQYDRPSVAWLFGILAQRKGRGTFRKIVVRDGSAVAGWYLYYLNPHGVSEVVQLAARPGTISEVLDHLLDDAERRGVIAVSGQVDPEYLSTYSEWRCLFHQRSSWILIHSKRDELLQPIYRGEAFLSRLEGEWWIGLQGGFV